MAKLPERKVILKFSEKDELPDDFAIHFINFIMAARRVYKDTLHDTNQSSLSGSPEKNLD